MRLGGRDITGLRGIVSIHALTRSATLPPCRKRRRWRFQSTHSRGVRRFWLVANFTLRSFQSTHSRGVRLLVLLCLVLQHSFNPRTHEECDLLVAHMYANIKRVSIHALTRSATFYGSLRYALLTVSIHALTRSATVPQAGAAPNVEFQSTHSRGVRPSTGYYSP